MKKVNMKYTIGEVQQDKLVDLGLDIKDAFILTYLKDMDQLRNIVKQEIEGKVYMWIDYERLISYLPALGIKTQDGLYRRFKKYEDMGLVKKHTHRAIVKGSYTFFNLCPRFFDLFEITKIEPTNEEYEEQLKKMGLFKNMTHKFKNGEIKPVSDGNPGNIGQDSVSISDGNPGHNTPRKILPKKDSSSTAAASEETFFKNLKELLIKNNFKNYNSQTLKNLENYSNGDLEEIKKVIKFMKLKNKILNSKILVAILKDGDHKVVDRKKVTRKEKIAHMLKITFQDEINDLCNQIAKSFGFGEYEKLSKSEGNIVNTELENIFCKRYNKLNIGRD